MHFLDTTSPSIHGVYVVEVGHPSTHTLMFYTLCICYRFLYFCFIRGQIWYKKPRVLWSVFHPYLWGSMIVNCQNFVASWGHKFVGNWFVTLQCKTILYFVKCSWGRSFLGKENPRNPPTGTPPPPNNDDSTVLHVTSV